MMHLNDYGLHMNGYRLVAVYHCFSKSSRMLIVECYTNGSDYLVRNFHSGKKAWDDVYDNAENANARVKQLFNLYNGHKRVF